MSSEGTPLSHTLAAGARGRRVLRRLTVALATALGAGTVAYVRAVRTPPTYIARTAVIVATPSQGPQAGTRTLAVSAQMAPPKMVSTVLDSRELAEQVGRVAGYPQRRRIQKNDDGTVVIHIAAETPEKAALIANAYPPVANAIVAGLLQEANQRSQRFLAGALEEQGGELSRAEARMVAFQRAWRAPDLVGQAQRTGEVAGRLEALIGALEVRVAALRRTLRPGHPGLAAAESELAARRAQMRALASGESGSTYLPMDRSAELQMGARRVLRDYAAQEQIYRGLDLALQRAKLGSSTVPALQVLDMASAPERVSGITPGTAAWMAAALGALFGLALAFARDWLYPEA